MIIEPNRLPVMQPDGTEIQTEIYNITTSHNIAPILKYIGNQLQCEWITMDFQKKKKQPIDRRMAGFSHCLDGMDWNPG